MIKTIKVIALTSMFAMCHQVSADSVGKVIVTKNKVQIKQQQNLKPAKRGSVLTEDASVVTGQKARAQLRFNDGTLTTLGENSEFVVHQYEAQSTKPSAHLELIKGAFRTITGTITKNDNPKFVVDTPVGSIGIRGTDFWGGYLQPDAVDILFIDGEHEIVVKNEFGEVRLTKPGQGTTVKQGQAPSNAKVWPKEKVQRAVATITIE